MHRKEKIILYLLITSICFLGLSSTNTFADAWFSGDYGNGSVSGGGGDGGGGGCSYGKGYLSCSGISWIFYKYIGGEKGKNQSYRFPETYPDTPDSSMAEIDKKCTSYGKGTGFWHSGRNEMAESRLYAVWVNLFPSFAGRVRGASDSNTSYAYSTTAGSFGHFSTMTYGQAKSIYNYSGSANQTSYGGKAFKPVGQKLYKKIGSEWVPMYEAVRMATSINGTGAASTDVLTAFKAAYKASGNGQWRIGLPDDIYAFCWSEELDGGDFNAKVTASANDKTSGTVEVDSDTFKLTFKHEIQRNNDSYSGKVTNTWSVNSNIKKENGTYAFNSANSGYKIVKTQTSESMTSPKMGETKEYCSTLTYTKTFDGTGKGTGNGTAKGCIKVHRKIDVSFSVNNTCTVKANGKTKSTTCGSISETNSKKWSIEQKSSAKSNYTSELKVPAGKKATNNATYKHGALTYGIDNAKCVRSNRAYTQFEYYENGTKTDSGPTLKETSTIDLPKPYSGNNKYATNAWRYPGCEDGTTKWQTFSSKAHSSTWNNTKESDALKLPAPAADGSTTDVVSVARNSQMKVINKYTENSGWSSTWAGSKITNTILRYRRYVNFSHSATIYANAGKSSKATIKHNSGDEIDVSNTNGYFTVTFDYSINRGKTDNVKDDGGEVLKVNNTWKSRETITPTDSSGKTYPSNGTYKQWHDYGSFESTKQANNVSGTKTQTVSGMLYYGQKVKICGNVYYGQKVRELEAGSDISKQGEKEAGCVTIKRGDGTCTTYNGTKYNFTHKNGYNIAELKVENGTTGASSNTNWDALLQSHTNSSIISTADIWARPGDNVRYTVNYCMGANYARSVHEKEGVNDGGIDTDLSATADTTANTSDDLKTNYLFSDDISTYTDGKTTPKTIHFTKRDSSGAITNDSLQKNIGTINSPSAGTSEYKCRTDTINLSSGLKNDIKEKQSIAYKINTPQSFMKGYYQVAGNMKKSESGYEINCNNRTKTLDVGTTMSEDIIWTDLRYVNSVNATKKGDSLSRAYIRTPYNYVATPYIDTNATPTGTVQIGSKVNFKPGIAVSPRKNCAFVENGYGDSNQQIKNCQNDDGRISEYATITKPTKVELKAYIANNKGEKIRDIDGSSKTLAVRANTKSNLLGITGHSSGNLNDGGPNIDGGYNIIVPDQANILPGDKICVDMVITPADSHNAPSARYVYGFKAKYNDSITPASTDEGDSSKKATSCLTIVKRPTISIENSNLYSATDITTSIASRYSDGEEYLFGSWSEYGVYGKVSIGWHKQGISSGARLGYMNSIPYSSTHIAKKSSDYAKVKIAITEWVGGPDDGKISYSYGTITTEEHLIIKTYRYDTDSGKYPTEPTITTTETIVKPVRNSDTATINSADSRKIITATDATVCNFSTQTFANSDCNNNNVGSTTDKKIGAEAATSFAEKILDKYGSAKANLHESKCDGSGTGVKCVEISGSKYIDFANVGTQAALLNNGGNTQTLYKATDNNAYIGNDIDLSITPVTKTKNDVDIKASSVIVYRAKNIIIDADIISGDNGHQDLSDMRMPIIIADNVYITGKPTRIDAIIIAKKGLNTCTWNNLGGSQIKIEENLTSDVCNKELHFSAPVVVNGTLVLNRTYGAGPTSQKVQRAEIFELNPATYLWSYDQMTRYSQAITTYSRELPTRY